MHFFFSILTLSTILAPVYAWRGVTEVKREMVVIPPDKAHIQFVGVEYKTASKKLREFYNYPNTADPTKWEGMHKLLEKNNTVEAGAKTNILRVPFNFNQLFIENSTTPVNETELNNLQSVVEAIVKSRAGPSPFVAIVPEVVNGTQRLRDADELYQFWRIIAKKFLHNNHVVFDLGLPATPERAIAADMSQEAIRAIRRAGARRQYIFVPTDMATLSDPLRFGIQDPSHRTLYEVDINIGAPSEDQEEKGKGSSADSAFE